MPPALLIGGSGGGACPVCGGSCTGSPPTDHLSTYPFLAGGRPKVPGTEGVDFVIAPHAITDHDLGRNVYGAGDRVPMADAVKYGLVDQAPDGDALGPDPEAQPKRGRRAGRAKHGPDEDRAHHGPAEDRGAGGGDRP